MESIVNYYYNLKVDNIVLKKDYYFIKADNTNYILKVLNEPIIELEKIINILNTTNITYHLLVLTKEGDSHRTHWTLPKCLEHKRITYHSENSYKEGFFKSACRGQEFVVECDKDILEWVKNIILTCSGH